LKIYLVY